MKQDAILPVSVKILGKEYRIACEPGEREALLDAANLLDSRMREVRDGGVSGQEKIAVMAALNLTHELLAQEKVADTDSQLRSISHLSSRIEKLLKSAEAD